MDTEIKFRVAMEDKARFERQAKSERRSLSDWIRLTLLEAVGPVFLSDLATGGDLSGIDRKALSVKLTERAKAKKAVGKILPKDPKEVAAVVAKKDTRTQQQKTDDFYRNVMAKGGKK